MPSLPPPPPPQSSSSSSSTTTVTRRRRNLTTALLLIFSLLKTLIFSLFSSLMADDFFHLSTSSSAAAAATSSAAADNFDDEDDDAFLRHPRRRRLAGPSPPSALSPLHDRLFFVPLMWWKDAEVREYESIEGVLFTTSSSGEDDEDDEDDSTSNDIVLRLKRQCGEVDVGNQGREFALISESMWFKALKWHSDKFSSRLIEDKGCSISVVYSNREVFPLQVRLSVLRETLSLLVKISPMDNSLLCYERACQIFDIESGLVHIWDFSGQMTHFFQGNGPVSPNGGLDHAVEEALLELQVYGFFDFSKGKQVSKPENAKQEGSWSRVSLSSCSIKLDGVAVNDSPSPSGRLQPCNRGYGETGLLGLTGLVNLGNTCFMNSAIQCLAHTPGLVDYFLGDFKKEINYENPLGMNGELALAFGDLLRKLWVPAGMPVSPKLFKLTLENFAPQFSGYNQHDSQELLAFLLDGLHEDLNRVKQKPYIEVQDAVGRPDEMVADEYWQNHLARNNSIIVDMCHGQYRSTLVCPVCKRVSVTFDPFMYLSLPLPSTTMRTMTVTIISTDGSNSLSSVTVSVPKCGRCEDLVQALGMACSLRDDETLLVAEVYNHLILRFLEDPCDSLALIRDDDCLVAYRLPKESESCQLVVFMHERSESYLSYGKERLCWKLFGIPLVARVSNQVKGYQIRDEYMKALRPFLNVDLDDYDDIENSDTDQAKMEASMSSSDDSLSSDDDMRADLHLGSDFHFRFTDERSLVRGHRIKLTRPLNFTGGTEKVSVLVSWPEDMARRYDTSHLSLLPEVFRRKYPTFKTQESVSLYKCLESFSKEEPLGPEDMWYCPSCKQHQQASKKLDLWRLPEILVVHLKRFSYNRFLKNKLETFVDFPIDKLDLGGFLAHKSSQHLDCYRLFAVSNHYGGLGGGHYTALVYHGSRWYEFNDSLVEPIREEDVKTSTAYVLFYRRISDKSAATPS